MSLGYANRQALREAAMYRRLRREMHCELPYKCPSCAYVDNCISLYWDGRIRVCGDGSHVYCECPRTFKCRHRE